MPPGDVGSLRDCLGDSADRSARHLHSIDASVALSDLAHGTSLGGRLPELRDRSVLIATGDQLTTAIALIELDGVARRLILCPPDVAREHLSAIVAEAEVDALVSDRVAPEHEDITVDLRVIFRTEIQPCEDGLPRPDKPRWVLVTSDTP